MNTLNNIRNGDNHEKLVIKGSNNKTSIIKKTTKTLALFATNIVTFCINIKMKKRTIRKGNIVPIINPAFGAVQKKYANNNSNE